MIASEIGFGECIGIVERSIRQESLPFGELVECQIGLVIEIAGIELGLPVVEVVVRAAAVVFGESATIEPAHGYILIATHHEKASAALSETKVTVILVTERVLSLEFAVIFPVYARLVDIVSVSDKGQLFFFVEFVVVPPSCQAVVGTCRSRNLAKGAFFEFRFQFEVHDLVLLAIVHPGQACLFRLFVEHLYLGDRFGTQIFGSSLGIVAEERLPVHIDLVYLLALCLDITIGIQFDTRQSAEQVFHR